MPAEDHPVKAFEDPIDFWAMLGDKRVHGVVPAYWDIVWDWAGTTPFYLICARGRSGDGLKPRRCQSHLPDGGEQGRGKGVGVPGAGTGAAGPAPGAAPACVPRPSVTTRPHAARRSFCSTNPLVAAKLL